MNSKRVGLAAVLVGCLAVLAGLSFVAFGRITMRHECEIKFLLEHGKPIMDASASDGNTGVADKRDIENRYDSIVDDFSGNWYPCRLDERVERCRKDINLNAEPENRTRSILSSMKLEVVGMPSTNFVYSCRLVISDAEQRNLDVYAKTCMRMVKERIAEDNKVQGYRAINNEYQRMRKIERMIQVLKKEGCEDNSKKEMELNKLRQDVSEIKQKIDEVLTHVSQMYDRLVIYESEPIVRSRFVFGKIFGRVMP